MLSFLKNKYVLIGYAVGFSVSLLAVTFSYVSEKGIVPKATAISPFMPFGGPITYVEYKCCYGLIVHISNYAKKGLPEKYMYYEGATQLYANYMIETQGECTLGNALPSGLCIEADEECEGESETDGTMLSVGTTLTPAFCVKPPLSI